MSTEPVLRAVTAAQVLVLSTTERVRQKAADARRSQDGLTTLEIVIWAVALFAAAGAAAAIITGFITKKTAEIK